MAGGNASIAARLTARSASDSAPGSRFRLLVSDGRSTAAPIDVTGHVVGAIAHALWQARGGDPTANWVDAERALDSLAAPSTDSIPVARQSSVELAEPKPASAPSAVPSRARQQPTRR